MPFTTEQAKAVLMNPNEFRPQMISEMIVERAFTSQQLQELEPKLDAQHKKAFEQAALLLKEKELYDKCMSADATYDLLKSYVDQYRGEAGRNAHIANHFREIEERFKAKERGKVDFDRFKDELDRMPDNKTRLDAVNKFLQDNPFTDFRSELQDIKKELQQKRDAEEAAQAELNSYNELLRNIDSYSSLEGKMSAIYDYEQNHPFSSYMQNVRDLKSRLLAEEKRRSEIQDENAWNEILVSLTSAVPSSEKKRMLEDYERNYKLHLNEVPEKMKQVEEELQADPIIDGILNDPDSDVIDYLRLIKRYPYKRERLRRFMLEDMKNKPTRYSREEMIWLIKGKNDARDQIPPVFTTEEIVGSGVMPLAYMNYIETHPTVHDDRDPGEAKLIVETNFDSAPNNTDVYFWGVPGSGKSTVLAGLLNVGQVGSLHLQILTQGVHAGYPYAQLLKNYLNNKLFPARTRTRNAQGNPFADPANDNQDNGIDDKFIQIIDAKLEVGDGSEHLLSIIEMPGERTLDFAAAPVKDIKKLDELLGSGTRQLFMNANRKVFFFVIDPNSRKQFNINYRGTIVQVDQAGVLDALVQFLKDVPGLAEKVDAVHVILSKSDMLENPNDLECIGNTVLDGYRNVITVLGRLCDAARGNINAQCGHRPHLFTFSLGKVYPGNMNQYKKDDAIKILKVIAANTWSVASKPTKWDSVVEWMNK